MPATQAQAGGQAAWGKKKHHNVCKKQRSNPESCILQAELRNLRTTGALRLPWRRMVAQHLTESFSHLWPIRHFCAWVFALMIQVPPDVTRMYGRWSLDLWTLSLRVVPSCFDDEHSVCSAHKTHTSQIPITEVIFDTRKYPLSQWANHRAVSADRILLPVWAEIKQQHCSHSLAEHKIIESLNEKPGYCPAALLWEWKETNWTVQ